MKLPFFPQPKGRTKLVEKAVAKRTADRQAAQFRLAVWLRDGARCQHCGRKLIRTIALVPNRGEVHHRRGRRCAPEDRYNVDAAILLCYEDHKRAQRHEITV